MKYKKRALHTAILMGLVSFGYNAQAALVNGTLLAFEPGSDCPPDLYCTLEYYGSYFGIDGDGDGIISVGEAAVLSPGTDGGIIIGQTQSYGEIDAEGLYFGNPAAHFTTVPVTVVNDLGVTKELDFSGWNMNWVGVNVSLEGDPANFSSDTGLATITCSTASCADGESFVLNYSAHIPLGDPSGAGGLVYILQLQGTISAVPVPAAVWLFGSGILGMFLSARRKKRPSV